MMDEQRSLSQISVSDALRFVLFL